MPRTAKAKTIASGRERGPLVIAHGGSDSKSEDRDGTDAAAEAGLRAFRRTRDPVDAVVAALVRLEDDDRFAAATGASLRFDGETIEMDAGVADSRGRYGAVTCIQDVRHPVEVARQLMDLPNCFLGGPAATAFARRLGHTSHDSLVPHTTHAWQKLVHKILDGEAGKSDNEWELKTLRKVWNYDRPFDDVFARPPPEERSLVFRKIRRGMALPKGKPEGSDTVGAVAGDGRRFAAATSTGGPISVLKGRIGDSPILGAGLFAGRRGAVVCSGIGDHILRALSARKIYERVERGATPRASARQALRDFPPWVDFLTATVTKKGWAVASNQDPAWSMAAA